VADPTRGEGSPIRAVLRAGVERTQTAARGLGSLATQLRARRLFGRATPGSAALLCVYRERNREGVRALVEEATRLRLSVALWALDGVAAPDLARATVGAGRGLRMDLLNRLWQAVRASAPRQVVVADDDVSFARGSLGSLLEAVAVCGFGIAQPARGGDAGWSHEITRSRALTLARETTFVEIGPMFVVSGDWVPRVLPFPEGFGMGWGLELVWLDLQREGCRLGVVDCVTVSHAAPERGREYDAGPEGERLRALLRERNLASPTDAQRTLGRWPVWRARPPWLADTPGETRSRR
jgi:hypothetical protein